MGGGVSAPPPDLVPPVLPLVECLCLSILSCDCMYACVLLYLSLM